MHWRSPSRQKSSRSGLVAATDLDGRRPANCGSSLLRFIMTRDDHPATACSAAAAGPYATHVSQRAFDAGLTSLIDGLAADLTDKAVSSPAPVNRKRNS